MEPPAPAAPNPAQVVLHPIVAELLRRRDQLRADLAALVERADRCLLVEIPHVLALYDASLGALECELLQVRAGNATVRRRIELVVARLNRGEAVTARTLADIDEEVRGELAAWWEELHRREREVTERSRWMQSFSPADPAVAGEVRRLYRELCRHLHPDATGGETPAYARHWASVQLAYRELDLEALGALHALLLDGVSADAPDALDGLRDECARLEERIRAQAQRLEKLLREPPLCHRSLLESPERVAERRQELLDALAAEKRRGCEMEQATADFGIGASMGGAPWAQA